MKNRIKSVVNLLSRKAVNEVCIEHPVSDYRYPFLMFSRDGRQCDLSYSDVAMLCGGQNLDGRLTMQNVVAKLKPAWDIARRLSVKAAKCAWSQLNGRVIPAITSLIKRMCK